MAYSFKVERKTYKMGSVEMMNVETAALESNLNNKIKELEGTIHMIAHNLRGAGGNIKMLAEVLQKKANKESTLSDDIHDVFTADEAIQFIHEGSSSLLNTLNTLMKVTDIQLNTSIQYNACGIVTIVQKITHQLHGFIHQKNAIINFDLEIETILYPAHYMESILYNLINNSLKFSKDDRPLVITISTYMLNSKQVLSVKDNGLGINLEKYSSRLFKLNQVFHSGYESKGIGLYITKTQIESLGGNIDVQSKVGEGSEFIVTF
ncbi:MAG: hypothetical protein JWQ38_1912 [Flavipsychrobacter sp.]|nr:hypothetical protein [Flavipsychrobacter sp.]